jgi:hypothetical protein
VTTGFDISGVAFWGLMGESCFVFPYFALSMFFDAKNNKSSSFLFFWAITPSMNYTAFIPQHRTLDNYNGCCSFSLKSEGIRN